MIRLNMAVAGLVTALLAASGAQAAESADALDAQCMVRASVVQAQTQLNPQGRAAAGNMVFYYMGRMVGRNPNVDITKQAKDAIIAIPKDKTGAITARCDKDLQAVARRFQDYNASLRAKP